MGMCMWTFGQSGRVLLRVIRSSESVRGRAYCAERMQAKDRARYQDPKRKAANKAASARSYERNREMRIQAATEWNKANPDKRRTTHLKTKYGITDADYDWLYKGQGGRCGICSEPHKRLVVDHDHNSGRVRGLLCRKCNAAIGQLNDSPALLRRALAWLEDN